jgi:hypothetical protein
MVFEVLWLNAVVVVEIVLMAVKRLNFSFFIFCTKKNCIKKVGRLKICIKQQTRFQVDFSSYQFDNYNVNRQNKTEK